MKQVAQVLSSGEILVVDVPQPQVQPGCVLVRNEWSLISAGTERTKLEMGRKGLIGKALARPDLVQQVIGKVRSEGISATARTVRERLDALSPLGYSCAGTVVGVGHGVSRLAVGDRVACAGAESAHHAEMVCVPELLCAKVPDGVGLDMAAYTTVGCVALQGIRQADVRLGERVLVIGLGLIGQISMQLLATAGCEVSGCDVSASQVQRAIDSGFPRCIVGGDHLIAPALLGMTDGVGFDAVIITAGAPDNAPVVLAGEVARDRARVVFVGATPVDAPRSPFYEKEVSFHMSRSYGPGRYDPAYESHGHDYPIGYVRWTEQRNMDAFLATVAKGAVCLKPLTTHTFDVEDATSAYNLLGSGEPSLGILLHYPTTDAAMPDETPVAEPISATSRGDGFVLVGVGNFATKVLVPAFKRAGVLRPGVVVSARGLSAADVSRRHGFAHAESSPADAFAHNGMGAAVIATRHDTHAQLCIDAMEAGLAVFVEKPLCLTPEELASVVDVQRRTGAVVMVGFNRRFAPATARLMQVRRRSEGPAHVVIRVDAGAIPLTHWIQDSDIGGGRLIGEGCHFIDLLAAITGSPIHLIGAKSIGSGRGPGLDDSFTVMTKHVDGSVGSLVYSAVGDPRMGKERIELFCAGATAVIDDFKTTHIADGVRATRTRGAQDKGHEAEVAAFSAAVRDGRQVDVLTFEECVHSTMATFAAVEAIRRNEWIRIDEYSAGILGS